MQYFEDENFAERGIPLDLGKFPDEELGAKAVLSLTEGDRSETNIRRVLEDGGADLIEINEATDGYILQYEHTADSPVFALGFHQPLPFQTLWFIDHDGQLVRAADRAEAERRTTFWERPDAKDGTGVDG